MSVSDEIGLSVTGVKARINIYSELKQLIAMLAWLLLYNIPTHDISVFN